MQNNSATGRQVYDIELQTRGAESTPVVYFKLAIKDGGKTDFIPFTAFRKTAELIAKYASQQGDQIVVSYKQRSSNYEKDGKTIYTVNNIVDRVEFLNTTKNDQQPEIEEYPPMPTTVSEEQLDVVSDNVPEENGYNFR